MKEHEDQIAEFDGKIIIQYNNSSDPEFLKKAWDKIKSKLAYMSLSDKPDFILDDNGSIESGHLEYNAETEEWEAVYNK